MLNGANINPLTLWSYYSLVKIGSYYSNASGFSALTYNVSSSYVSFNGFALAGFYFKIIASVTMLINL